MYAGNANLASVCAGVCVHMYICVQTMIYSSNIFSRSHMNGIKKQVHPSANIVYVYFVYSFHPLIHQILLHKQTLNPLTVAHAYRNGCQVSILFSRFFYICSHSHLLEICKYMLKNILPYAQDFTK